MFGKKPKKGNQLPNKKQAIRIMPIQLALLGKLKKKRKINIFFKFYTNSAFILISSFIDFEAYIRPEKKRVRAVLNTDIFNMSVVVIEHIR